ncbi:unnamed protein product [Phytomonas sp. EM1]|nr:unnamed protein product [Phytomonas sp. EM1]|eukprot:CCW63058.1 unnamed protein product [Phytomonas sp. isolate EM1]
MSDERDNVLVQAFLSHGENQKDCLRVFARGGGNNYGCYVLGWWAVLIAKEYIKSSAVLKDWGTPAQPLAAVVVNENLCKEVIRDCLLHRGVSVEYYERAAGGGSYACVQRGSPGNISDFEASLFEFEETEIQLVSTASLVLSDDGAIRASNGGTSSGIRVGFASLNATLRQFSFSEYVDTAQLVNLDALVTQTNIKELTLCTTGTAHEEECVQNIKRMSERAGAILHLSTLRELRQRQKQSALSRPLDSLADLLRVPEERIVLDSYPLATQALENLMGELDVLDPTNRRVFYLKHIAPSTYMKLDTAAVEALHLVSKKPEPRGSIPRSVFTWLNRCVTGMGARVMRQWLLQPLRNVDDINQRLSMVELFVESPAVRDMLIHQVLKRCGDMDRLNRKLQRRSLALKDTQSFLAFVDLIPEALQILKMYNGQSAKLLADEFIAPLEDIHEHMGNLRLLITSTVDFSDRAAARMNAEFDDELQEIHHELKGMQAEVDKEYGRVLRTYDWNERQLKCEYHHTYGYVFRVARKEDRQLRASSELIVVSTSKDGVRFTSENLSALSDRYRAASEAYEARQQDLKRKLVDTLASYLPVLDDAKEMIARLDVFVAWALVVTTAPRGMVRPVVHDPFPRALDEEAEEGVPRLSLKNVRHPLVELRTPGFVANSVHLSARDGVGVLLTGPNMGGKSTYMRSIGIATVLAQAGCYVPADAAELQLRDAVMCRIGATDHLAQGVSTFMVEMLESAAILSSATPQTLAIVDELGRGTSTYDGFGLAWAIVKDIAVRIGATVLFSTHFHELTALPAECGCMVNAHFGGEIDAEKGTLRFSYRVEPGPCGRSYGIEVAALANMPEKVVQNARKKALELENFGSLAPASGLVGTPSDEDASGPKRNVEQADSEVITRIAGYAKRIRALNFSPIGSREECEAMLKELRQEIENDPAALALIKRR